MEQIQALRDALTLLDEKVEKRMLLIEDEYRKLEGLMDMLSEKLERNLLINSPAGEIVRAGLGGAAVKELLAEIDLEKLATRTARRNRDHAGAAPRPRHQAAGSGGCLYRLQSSPGMDDFGCRAGDLAGTAPDGAA